MDGQEVKSERTLGENRAASGAVEQQEVNQAGAGRSYRRTSPAHTGICRSQLNSEGGLLRNMAVHSCDGFRLNKSLHAFPRPLFLCLWRGPSPPCMTLVPGGARKQSGILVAAEPLLAFYPGGSDQSPSDMHVAEGERRPSFLELLGWEWVAVEPR